MSRTSHTLKVPKDAMVIIRQWQYQICINELDFHEFEVKVRGEEGGVRSTKSKVALCAAALLNNFAFAYDWKMEQVAEARIKNDIAAKHGDDMPFDESPLIAKTLEMLSNDLLGLYSKELIRKGVARLVEKGLITVHRNPNERYKFDQTSFYRYNVEKVNKVATMIAEGMSPEKAMGLNTTTTVVKSTTSGENKPITNKETTRETTEETAEEAAMEKEEGGKEAEANTPPTQHTLVEQSFNLVADSPSPTPTCARPPLPLPPEAAYWNANCGKLRKVIAMNPERQTMLAARRKEELWVSNYAEAVKRVAASEFCNGNGSSGWKADFKWMLKPNTMAKIMEGTYDNRTPSRPAQPPVHGDPTKALLACL